MKPDSGPSLEAARYRACAPREAARYRACASRIRVLKFLNHFFIGGTERQFVHVANGLNRSRFAVDIACHRREGPLLEMLHPDLPVHTYSVNGSFLNYKSIRNQARLIRDIRKKKFDIVHCYGWYPNVFAIPPSRLSFHPVIIASVRDAGAYMTPAKIQTLKIVCAISDCVLANSEAGRAWLIEQGVRERKIEVIRNGIVVPHRAERPHGLGSVRQEFGIPAGTPICACIGRVVSGKGIEFYLQAARILAEQRRDVRFLMIGAHSTEEHYRPEIEALAGKLNIGDRIIFTGQREDVPRILQEVDIVVHPSLTEGLSNVILEAMAAGIPVVATRAGGNSELVQDGHTGFMVPVRDAVQIATAVSRLLDEPQMARALGERARQRVIDEFALDRMLSKTEALYLRLLEKPIHYRAHETNGFIN